MKLTATTAHSGATVKVGKFGGTLSSVTSGTASEAIALILGRGNFEVEVTAQDGTTKKQYYVLITRNAVPTNVCVKPGAFRGGPTIVMRFSNPGGLGLGSLIRQVKESSASWPTRKAVDDDYPAGTDAIADAPLAAVAACPPLPPRGRGSCSLA